MFPLHKTLQLIYHTNQFKGFYLRETLLLHGLTAPFDTMILCKNVLQKGLVEKQSWHKRYKTNIITVIKR